jgi:hypothetical protein
MPIFIAALDLYADPESIDVNIFIDSNKSTTVKEYINSICIARSDADWCTGCS